MRANNPLLAKNNSSYFGRPGTHVSSSAVVAGSPTLLTLFLLLLLLLLLLTLLLPMREEREERTELAPALPAVFLYFLFYSFFCCQLVFYIFYLILFLLPAGFLYFLSYSFFAASCFFIFFILFFFCCRLVMIERYESCCHKVVLITMMRLTIMDLNGKGSVSYRDEVIWTNLLSENLPR